MDANMPQHVPMHIEIAESSEQAENRVRNIISPRLRLKGNTEDFLKNKLVVRQVEKNVFIAGTNRIASMFYTENWEVIMNLNELRDEYYFKQAGYLAGYREITSDTGPVNLYHIQDIDDKGNPLSGTKPIDKFSREYYQAFMDIAFYDDRLILETFKKPDAIDKPTSDNKRTFSNIDDKLLLSFANWVMRIKDLTQLKKQGQISEVGYQTTIALLRKNLLNTIGDYRFERINQEVMKEELDSYLKDGLIDQVLYARAIQKLEQVQKLRKAMGDKHSEITDQTHTKMVKLLDEKKV